MRTGSRGGAGRSFPCRRGRGRRYVGCPARGLHPAGGSPSRRISGSPARAGSPPVGTALRYHRRRVPFVRPRWIAAGRRHAPAGRSVVRTRTGLAACVAVVLFGSEGLAEQAPPGCEPVGDIRFICDLTGPEDLAVVPGAEWVIASGNQAGGRIHLVDVDEKTTSVLFPTPARTERLDRAAWPTCPGPLDPAELDGNEFRAHGLYLDPGEDGVHTLYVVHHGRRESIEVFEVDAAAGPVTLAWVGCAVAPEPLRLNSVVALPEGGFAATSTSTGDVWEWRAEGGWSLIAGHRGHDAERSRDFPRRTLALRRGVARREADAPVARADAAAEGRGRGPLPAGQLAVGRRRRRAPGGGPRRLRDAAGDLERGDHRSRDARGSADLPAPAHRGFASSTAAIRIGGEIWLGTNRGGMIAYFPAPDAEPAP